FFFFQAEDGIRDRTVTGVQTCALPISGVEEFKISLPVVAAFLTLIGYSVNDTIVIFDRLREIRGKSTHLTAQMLNDSVNLTMSRSEEHTSELQSPYDLVCRLLLEKKKE